MATLCQLAQGWGGQAGSQHQQGSHGHSGLAAGRLQQLATICSKPSQLRGSVADLQSSERLQGFCMGL